MKELKFKDFSKALDNETLVKMFGWYDSKKNGEFKVKNTPKYFKNLPVRSFRFDKNGNFLKVYLAFSKEAF